MESAGRLPEPMRFDGNLSDNFKRFYQNFELYLIATEKDKKADPIKIAILLNTIGSEGIEIYNTFRLTEEQKKKYDDVVAEFKRYCTPRKNRTYERFVFNNRNQGIEEPFDQFLGDLKKLIQSCEYADQEDTILVDRIILGTNDLKVQEKLLNIQNITLDNAVEICRNSEATKKQLRSVRNKEEATIDFIRKKKQNGKSNEKDEELNKDEGSKKQFKCSKCGRTHGYRECPAYGKTCHKCGRMNHFSSVCKAKIKEVKDILKDEASESEDETLYVNNVVKVGEVMKKDKSVRTETVKINGKAVKFKIDTGSEVNIMSLKEYKSITEGQQIQRTHTVLQIYGGTKITPMEKVNLRCKNETKNKILEFFVVDMNVKSILRLLSIRKLVYIKCTNSIKMIDEKEKFI